MGGVASATKAWVKIQEEGGENMLFPAASEIPYEARRMFICVDAHEDGVLEGKLYSAFSPEPLCFGSMLMLLRHMDDWLDGLAHIQRHEDRRTLLAPSNPREGIAAQLDKQPVPGGPAVPDALGTVATFSLMIQFRQNATWQGEVTWVEQKRSTSFRSVLELLRMMDDVLQYSV